MRTYKIHHVDAFTDKLFGGNPTITVLDADSMSEKEMKQVARQMNLSETGFLVKSDRATCRLRFFTPPGNEIKFCGHATVGALCTIAKEGLFGCIEQKNTLTIETNAGVLHVDIDLNDPQKPYFIFDAPKIELVKAPYALEEVLAHMGINRHLIDFSKPLMLEKTNNYLYFTANNLTDLGKIAVDMPQTIEFAKKDGIVIFCILTNQTFREGFDLHARGFAPLVGVPEDPFTGSMQGGLAAYAIEQELVDPNKKWLNVEQGNFVDRPGITKLEVVQKAPVHVRLHTQGIPLFSSEITLA